MIVIYENKMLTSALRNGLLKSQNNVFSTRSLLASSLMMGNQQASILGMAPSACFAKYQRNKPHLNVGTIGKSLKHSTELYFDCFLSILN